jgi:hypothetical protein
MIRLLDILGSHCLHKMSVLAIESSVLSVHHFATATNAITRAVDVHAMLTEPLWMRQACPIRQTALPILLGAHSTF